MPDSRSWTLPDVLDFEALLHLDEQSESRALLERDRALMAGSGIPNDEREDRDVVFRLWLEARRTADRAVLPGTWLVGGLRMLGTVAAIAGVILGFSAAMAALYYSGSRPVNVAVFLAVTVFIQWLLLFWSVLVWAARGFRRSAGRALARFAGKLGCWLAGAGDHLPGDQRMRLQGEVVALRNLAGRNGDLLTWPPILALQGFGIAWNIGVLAALLLRVAFTDLAFGWESTWASGPETAHAIAQGFAAPWTWLVPGASPTLEQVRQSWFHYVSGTGALDRAAMQSWWPWLVGMVLVYGLGVRMLLLIWARAELSRALRKVDFHEPRHLEPWLRIGGRLIHTDKTPDSDEAGVPEGEIGELPRADGAAACLMIDRSLSGIEESVQVWVRSRLGWNVDFSESVEADFPSGNQSTFERVAGRLSNAPRWLVVLPAPYTAFSAAAQFLTNLKAKEPQGVKIERGILVVSLDSEGRPIAPEPEWLRYWRDFLRTEFPDAGMIEWRQS